MAFDRSLRTTFDAVAELYDEARPGYPQQLIEDVISLSGIPDDGRILEVGCGTGKATVPFARRGYAMLCLELGGDLARVAGKNCRPYPRVEIDHTSFEDWPLQREAFDLVISAQAFHWIPPDIGYAKVAGALKDSGAMALFWNQYPEPEGAFFRALAEVYADKAPQLVDPAKRIPHETLVEKREAEIRASGAFGEVLVKRYPWSERYSADEYVKLLNTYSDHRSLPEATRQQLFAAVHELIDRFGGVVEKPYVAVLYFAKVKR